VAVVEEEEKEEEVEEMGGEKLAGVGVGNEDGCC
jgi:hypothetical protein